MAAKTEEPVGKRIDTYPAAAAADDDDELLLLQASGVGTKVLRRETRATLRGSLLTDPALADIAVALADGDYLALDITRGEIPTFTIPFRVFRVDGFYEAGDQGSGALYMRGTSDGPMAIQDAAGTWFNLFINNGVVPFGHLGGKLGRSNEAFNAGILSAAEVMLAARGGGTIVFPGDNSVGWWFTPSKPHDLVPRRFDGYTDRYLFNNESGIYPSFVEDFTLGGPHPTIRRVARALNVNVEGSGTDLSGTGDNAFEINISKINWRDSTLAQTGEMAGFVVNGRQGGPNTGPQNSLSGFGIDVGTVEGAGFCCQFESATTWFGPIGDGTPVLYRITTQCGVLNSRTGTRIGLVQNAVVGSMEAGLQFQTEDSARWVDVLRSLVAAVGNWVQFRISDLGKLTWRLADDDANTVSLEGDANGAVAIKKGDATTLFKVGQTGELTLRTTDGVAENYRTIKAGAGFPEGAIMGNGGDLFLRQDPTGSTAAYLKFGNGSNTGWRPLRTGVAMTTAQRTALSLNTTTDRGFEVFDTDLGKNVEWNGTGWQAPSVAAV